MNIKRLFNTVRYLKPVQLYGRAWFRLYKPTVDNSRLLDCDTVKSNWVKSVVKVVSQVGPKSFCFLNQKHEMISPDDWNHCDWDKLWLYNLHYFDDLNAECAEKRQSWHVDLLERWIVENPVGWGNGWEPYPISLRIVNWIKWYLSGNQLSAVALQSLEVQARYLRKRLEIHLLGNHLLANAKALVFAGLFFKGQEANEWVLKGLKILSEELSEQVLSDGGHFERSPMYHAIVQEDLLDLINILRVYGQDITQDWLELSERMLFWLRGMIHPDGELSFFNDAAFGIAPRTAQLIAYAERLGLNCCVEGHQERTLIRFEQSGYLRWQSGPVVALLDVGEIGPLYLPGHAHADTLSFELSLYRQRVFVNSGTSCYGVSDERLRQRSTSAHNTVEVDGESSSEVWGGFRVARRAHSAVELLDLNKDVETIRAQHNGYRRLPGKNVHMREWLIQQGHMQVTDRVTGQYKRAVARLYVHPDIHFAQHGEMFVAQVADGQEIQVTFAHEDGARLTVASWHPEFGTSIANQCIVADFSCGKLDTFISWSGV